MPRADDHLVLGADPLDGAVPHDLDADAAASVDDQPPRARSGQDLEVRRVGDRRQEGRRHALAHAVLDVELRVRHAVELLAVVVVVERDPGLLGGVDDRGVDRVRLVLRQHVQRPADPVVLARTPIEVLGPLEQRQHVGVAPAVVPQVRPGVVVAAMTARVDHPVQRARSAEHLAARPLQLAVRARCLGDRAVAPVLLAVPQLEDARWVVDRRVDIRPARLEQHDAGARVDETPRDDGSGRPGPDDDDVGCEWSPVAIPCHHPLLSSRCRNSRTRSLKGSRS